MKTLGLTGGIGSGKTTVANFFKKLGIPVFIADIEAKELMNENPKVIRKIQKVFGNKAYKNGLLNRAYLSSTVFKDKAQLERLNAIVHPAVAQHFLEWEQKQNAAYIVYEAAILFETGSYKNFDYTLLVTAPYEERLARVQKRDQVGLKEIKARMDHQWPDEKKQKLANFTIENTNIANTEKEVLKIHQFLLKTV